MCRRRPPRCPAVAAELDALVARATSRDARGRPADAVEMLAEVRVARAALSPAQLDEQPSPGPVTAVSVPTGSAPATPGSEDRTSVVQLPAGTFTGPQDDVDRTTQLLLPPDDPAAPRRRAARPRSRGPLAVLVALLVLIGVGTGVWYIMDGQFTTVPGVLALSQSDAQKKLSTAGLDSRVTRDFSLTVPRGDVISTDPAPGRRVRGNGTVTVVVSKGPQHARVPDVAGRDLATARREIDQAGLTPGPVTRTFSDSVPRGQVISTDPAGASEHPPGTRVAITVSRGAPVEVPDVIGESVTDAQQKLEDAGLKVVLAPGKVFSDEADKDTVAQETPDRGAQVGEGDSVTITVSKGQQMLNVPDVTGKSKDDAQQILQDAGFEVRVISVFFGDTVFSQSPDGEGQAPKGATVTIWVR